DAASPGWGDAEAAAGAPPVTELPPGGGSGPVSPSPPGMAYAVSLAPPAGAYGQPRRSPHRDTALRTPLGWQTASLPGRRQSRLIAGAAIGVLSVVTAVVLTLRDDGEPSSRAHPAISGSATVTPGPATGASISPASSPAPASVPGPASVPASAREPAPSAPRD